MLYGFPNYCFGTALEENHGVFETRNLGRLKYIPPPALALRAL